MRLRNLGFVVAVISGASVVGWVDSASAQVPVTVTINQAAGQEDPTSISPINFTVVFSDAVSGFQSSDVFMASGSGTPTVTGGPITYNVAVSG